MEALLVLALMMVCAVHSQPAGFDRYGWIIGCDETSTRVSFSYNGEIAEYFDYEEKQTVMTLPDFADPIVIADLSKDAYSAQEFCKDTLAVINDAYMNPPEELEPPWTSIYTKSDVKLKTKNTLLCHVTDFFPPPVRVSWTKNDLNVTEGATLSPYYQNSDGTLSVFSTLSFTPEEGDVYSCTVEHRALEQPQTRIWDVQVEQSSVFPSVVCVVGVCLGVIGAAAGIFLIFRANALCSCGLT
ncbi:H-2 class II histocompatibility antigen, A-U alpha chain-like [Colossoma macropomum]|uniref:H-2 class II histocompatibility antigen, A-U alpha chain-like n=1 Tax=Colossoma macropomum TaxID=42526 RepID=UPI001864BC3A|nr:H-2 class II histocompatibility antigen, A-U alpha chain-like [Colossoma macropomum]